MGVWEGGLLQTEQLPSSPAVALLPKGSGRLLQDRSAGRGRSQIYDRLLHKEFAQASHTGT